MRADDTQHGIGATHFDQCLNALMLLAFVALSHGDAVGAMTFGVADGAQKRFAPRKGKQTLNALMAALADVEATATFSDYERIAAECLSQKRKRGLVVMITNSRNEDAPQLDAALALLRTRHIVILANLREEVVALIAGQALTRSRKRARVRRRAGIRPRTRAAAQATRRSPSRRSIANPAAWAWNS